jgi:hypothetical protein
MDITLMCILGAIGSYLALGKFLADDIVGFFFRNGGRIGYSLYFMTLAAWPWVLLAILSYGKHQRWPRWTPWWMNPN